MIQEKWGLEHIHTIEEQPIEWTSFPIFLKNQMTGSKAFIELS